MRWVYRLTILFLLVLLFNQTLLTKTQTFISWHGEKWTQRIHWQVNYWREQAQDFPANVDAGIRQLMKEYFPDAQSKAV